MPNVTVLFDGLMVFSVLNINGINTCQVGLHTNAPGHEIKITVLKMPDETHPVDARIYRHAEIRAYERLDFLLPNKPPTGVQFNTNPNCDFKRVLFLEGKDFFNRRMEQDICVLKPTLHITSAILGSEPRTQRNYWRVKEDVIKELFKVFDKFGNEKAVEVALQSFENAWENDKPHTLGDLPEYAKAELSLDANQTLRLEGIKACGSVDQLITPIGPGADSYKIYFENLPPGHGKRFDTQGKYGQEREHTAHAVEISFHFTHYYTAFKNTEQDVKYVIVRDKGQMGVEPAPPCNVGRTCLPDEYPCA